MYGVPLDERERLMTLAVETKARPWWGYYDVPSTFVGLEAAAATISDYKSAVVPGLLQTDGYARAVVTATLEDPTPAAVEEQLQARRTRRLRLVGEHAVRVHAVIDEASLRRQMGGAEIMHGQVLALIRLAGQPNINLQFLPFRLGAHPALESNFTIFHFEEDVSDIVYIEGLFGEQYLESATDLVRYRRVFNQLTAIAPTPAESVRMLSEIADSCAS
jgi:L-rhamnose isomerase